MTLHEEIKNNQFKVDRDVIFEQMMSEFSSTVYRLAYARTLNKAQAEDILQEVFLSYYKTQPDFIDEEHAKAWFLRVTINKANSFWRSPWNKIISLNDKVKNNPDDNVQLEQVIPSSIDDNLEDIIIQRLDMTKALRSLNSNERELIHLYYYEELSTEQIAEMLNRKSGTVRMQLTRARQRLKAALEQ